MISRRCIIYLIIIVTSFALPSGATAAEDRYRVEVLVFTHLEFSEEPRELDWPRNYSESIDFLAPPTEEDTEEGESGDEPESQPVGTEPDAAEQVTIPEAGEPLAPAGEALADGEPEEPEPIAVQVEQMGPTMQEAWRRLRLSAPFRPQQYLSWEQGSEPPFPLLRVHDQEVVMTDDPWADLRVPVEEDIPAAGETAAGPGDALHAAEVSEPGPEEDSEPGPEEDSEPGPEEDSEEALPDPLVYYRLDGTARLRRSRFLHVDLDISLREPVYDEAAARPPYQAVLPAEMPDPGPPRPSSFLVHRLEQSRQIRTGRLEYFDSPVIGVLVYVTGVDPEAGDTVTDNP